MPWNRWHGQKHFCGKLVRNYYFRMYSFLTKIFWVDCLESSGGAKMIVFRPSLHKSKKERMMPLLQLICGKKNSQKWLLAKNCIQGSNFAAGKMFAIKKCNILSLRWAKSGPIKSPNCEINQHQNRAGVIAGPSMALEKIYKITRKSNSSLKMPSQKPI